MALVGVSRSFDIECRHNRIVGDNIKCGITAAKVLLISLKQYIESVKSL